MRVKDLIERLQQEDPETNVVINGYEGGVNTIGNIDKGVIVKDVNTAWYYGKHEFLSGDLEEEIHWEGEVREPCIRLRG